MMNNSDEILNSSFEQPSQVTFKPARGSFSDLIDLSDIFEDDFYPADLDYSEIPATEQIKAQGDLILIPPIAPAVVSESLLESTKVDSGTNSRPKTMKEIKVNLSDCQRVERRERNREHAKRSRIRKKLLLDTLQYQLAALRQENIHLRRVIAERIPSKAAQILNDSTIMESNLLDKMHDDSCTVQGKESLKPSPLTANIASGLLTSSNLNKPPARQMARVLMEPDYRLIQSLVTSQQNFVLSDPSLPDNPIVYASEGFCKLTGYQRQEVLGRNCRFLQGPLTDQNAVEIIRRGIAEGKDISVCLLNYKSDGSPFWNQFFLAALKDADGQIVNYVGVQCEVNNISVYEIKDRVKKLPIPSGL